MAGLRKCFVNPTFSYEQVHVRPIWFPCLGSPDVLQSGSTHVRSSPSRLYFNQLLYKPPNSSSLSCLLAHHTYYFPKNKFSNSNQNLLKQTSIMRTSLAIMSIFVSALTITSANPIAAPVSGAQCPIPQPPAACICRSPSGCPGHCVFDEIKGSTCDGYCGVTGASQACRACGTKSGACFFTKNEDCEFIG